MADGSLLASNAIRLPRTIRAADLFCGAGGTSTGARRAIRDLGRKLDLVAINHWQTAIDTHTRMHPEARHLCADLEHVRPRAAVPGGVLDLLMASPTCTYYSRARGGRPVHDQQRMDPWHVVRWCTDLRVHRLLVENVPEMTAWGPCNAQTGKPIKSREGEYFHAWLEALKAVGFNLDWRILCCADFGDPTTRERFMLIGRSDGKPLRWPEPTHIKGGSTDMLSTRAPWRGAVEIIDWDHLGKDIFTRKKPLAPNTVRRLLAGARKNHWPRQHVAALQALLDGREPQLDLTPAEVDGIKAMGVPVVMATGAVGVARGIDQPIPTVTGGGDGGARPHFAVPLLMGVGSSNVAKPVDEPCPTITTGGGSSPKRPGNARPQLVMPIIAPYYGNGNGRSGESAAEPLPAATAKPRFGLASPVLIQTDQTGGGARPRSPAEPLGAVVSKQNTGLAQPFLVPSFGEADGQKPRTHAIGEPLPAVTASGHQQLAQPVIVTHRGTTPAHLGSSAAGVEQPLRTISGGGDKGGVHAALAQPFVMPATHHDASDRVRRMDEPLPTITGANRGELTLAQPSVVSYRVAILYRMLNWRELARGMSFDDEGEVYEFAGTATEITKQIGNAVPGRTAKALVRALLDPK